MITDEQMQKRLEVLTEVLYSINELEKAHQAHEMMQDTVDIDFDLYNSLRAHAVYVLEARRRAAIKMLDLLLED